MTPTEGTVTIGAVRGVVCTERADTVAREEPLEIRLEAGGKTQTVAITMRTPGADAELAAGFLWGEGIVTDPAQILGTTEGGTVQPGGFRNIVSVRVREMPEIGDWARRFYLSSSCGVCGKASLEAIEMQGAFDLRPGVPVWQASVIHTLADKLRAAQETFDSTGGLHAAGLFDAAGNLVSIREDVGRHNAMDKIVGAAVLASSIPLSESLLFVSGRASFELVQKAVMAGIPALAAVGAPSSLAVALAQDAGLTLLGFVRGERFNIYAGAGRIGVDRV